jgi:hypothetical protein
MDGIGNLGRVQFESKVGYSSSCNHAFRKAKLAAGLLVGTMWPILQTNIMMRVTNKGEW